EWIYRLPSEAQWEYGCRASTTTRFSFGDDESMLGDHAWIASNSSEIGEMFAHSVGQKKPNNWGLHDMHGNLTEWCLDSGIEALPGGVDPEFKIGDFYKAIRGGNWGSQPAHCTASIRDWSGPQGAFRNRGFRVVCVREAH